MTLCGTPARRASSDCDKPARCRASLNSRPLVSTQQAYRVLPIRAEVPFSPAAAVTSDAAVVRNRHNGGMNVMSPRELDRAVERRWPRLFRFNVRQALWMALSFQVLGMVVLFSKDYALSAGPFFAGSIGLLTRVLLETRGDPPVRSS
jgi:hypothetical protein